MMNMQKFFKTCFVKEPSRRNANWLYDCKVENLPFKPCLININVFLKALFKNLRQNNCKFERIWILFTISSLKKKWCKMRDHMYIIEQFSTVRWGFFQRAKEKVIHRGVFRNLSRGGLNFVLFPGRGSASVGAWKPHKINRFHWSRGGLAPIHPPE